MRRIRLRDARRSASDDRPGITFDAQQRRETVGRQAADELVEIDAVEGLS